MSSQNGAFDTWCALSEEVKREFFAAHSRNAGDYLFNKLSREIRGFPPRAIRRRSPAIAKRIDNLLFEKERDFARDIIVKYFADYEPELNRRFVALYLAISESQPLMNSRDVVGAVTRSSEWLQESSDYSKMYLSALECWFPFFFDSEPLPEQARKDLRAVLAPPTGVQASNRDPSKPAREATKSPIGEVLEAAGRKAGRTASPGTPREPPLQEAAVAPRPHDIVQPAAAQMFYEWLTMPIDELMQVRAAAFIDFAQQYNEGLRALLEISESYRDQEHELQEQLDRLSCERGVHLQNSDLALYASLDADPSISALVEEVEIATVRVVTAAEAIERLRAQGVTVGLPLPETISALDIVQLEEFIQSASDAIDERIRSWRQQDAVLSQLEQLTRNLERADLEEQVQRLNSEYWQELLEVLRQWSHRPEAVRESHPLGGFFESVSASSEIIGCVARLAAGSRSGRNTIADLLLQARDGDGLAARFYWDTLAMLSWNQMYETILDRSAVARPICEFALAVAIRRKSPTPLKWVRTLSTAAVAHGTFWTGFDNVLRIAEGRNAAELAQPEYNLTGGHEGQGFEKLAKCAHSGAGWSGNFKRLRDYVWEQYVMPTLELAESGQIAAAWKAWKAFGSEWDLIQVALGELGLRQKEVKKHINKTRKYLSDFGEVLCDVYRAGNGEGVRIATPTAVGNSFGCDVPVCGWGIQLNYDALFGKGPAGDLGLDRALERFDAEGAPDNLLSIASVPDCLIGSLTRALSSETAHCPTEAVLAEALFLVGRGDLTVLPPVEIVAQLVEKKAYRHLGALRLRSAAYAKALDEAASRVKRDFEARNEAILSEGAMAASKFPPVQAALDRIDESINDLRPDIADDLVAVDLEIALEVARELLTPEYSEKMDWLAEAGWCEPTDQPLAELERTIAKVKVQARNRRACIEAISAVAKNPEVREKTRNKLEHLAVQLDRPSMWPAATPVIAADAIAAVGGFLVKKKAQAEIRPELYQRLEAGALKFITLVAHRAGGQTESEELDSYVLDDLIKASSPDTEDVVAKLAEYCQRHGAPETDVLGAPDEPSIQPVKVVNAIRARAQAVPPANIRRTINQESLRAYVMRLADARGTSDVMCSLPAYEHAQKEKQWARAASIVARLSIDGEPWDDSEIPGSAVAALVCNMRTAEGSVSREGAEFCLYALSWHLVSGSANCDNHYIDRESVASAILHAFAVGLGCSDYLQLTSLEQRNAIAESFMSHMPAVRTANTRWLADVMMALAFKPNGGAYLCATLVLSLIWEKISGHKNQADVRANVLMAVFDLREFDQVLVELAGQQLPQFETTIRKILAGFRAPTEQADARLDADRLAIWALNIPVAQKGMSGAWRTFVAGLRQRLLPEFDEESFGLAIEALTIGAGRAGKLTVSITPAPRSMLKSTLFEAQIVGDGVRGVVEAIDLLCERGEIVGQLVEDILFEFDGTPLSSSVISVAFRAVATTVQGKEKEVRGTYEMPGAAARNQPLTRDEIERSYQGRRGRPVLDKAFHGRTREMESIRSALAGTSGSQDSLMIVGQRRIGKTSMLYQALREYPPRAGAVCGIFSSIGGCRLSEGQDLSSLLYELMTDLMDPGELNLGLRNYLERKVGTGWERRLRKIKSDQPLSRSLTRFADEIGKMTNGEISRIAFFVDEFQDILKFPPAAYENVMWQLRTIVQESRKVSLVLTGSGFTKKLTGEYSNALFGSIGEIAIRPFDLAGEFEAVARTLFPVEIRDRVVADGSKLHELVVHAHELTGGHPWYLSMLGWTAVQHYSGCRLTKAMLTQVARVMVGVVPPANREIEGRAEHFYGYLFASLDIFRDLASYAKLILANIARQVTAEYPWLTMKSALEHPLIEELDRPIATWQSAVDLLTKEDILERSYQSQTQEYKIRVPLVAEALRADADRLLIEAFQAIRLGVDE